jgi:hypothetical protein
MYVVRLRGSMDLLEINRLVQSILGIDFCTYEHAFFLVTAYTAQDSNSVATKKQLRNRTPVFLRYREGQRHNLISLKEFRGSVLLYSAAFCIATKPIDESKQ